MHVFVCARAPPLSPAPLSRLHSISSCLSLSLSLSLSCEQDMRLLCSRCGAHDIAMGVINEVILLASQGNSSPSVATMFNLSR